MHHLHKPPHQPVRDHESTSLSENLDPSQLLALDMLEEELSSVVATTGYKQDSHRRENATSSRASTELTVTMVKHGFRYLESPQHRPPPQQILMDLPVCQTKPN